jgi:hypothetical protein
MVQQDQAPEVTRDAKVAVMALQHSAQPLVLSFHRPMHHPLALLIERFERSRKPFFRRELAHHRITLPRGAPYMHEPEEGKKGRRQHRASTPGGAAHWSEVDQLGFIRMQLQAELAQPLPEHR